MCKELRKIGRGSDQCDYEYVIARCRDSEGTWDGVSGDNVLGTENDPEIVGHGRSLVPGPRVIEYPVFLDSDTIRLLAYPVESAIAEKLQANDRR